MDKIFLFILFPFLVLSGYAQSDSEKQIGLTLDSWHKAAANANFNDYFSIMSDDAIFIGTDATENWTKHAFMAYAKPYFEKGKAWSFTCIERHVYFNETKTIAWFDELLDTRMKICRGSGVLILEKNQWKIKHYVLSMTIPNDVTDDVIKIKSPIEENLIVKVKSGKK